MRPLSSLPSLSSLVAPGCFALLVLLACRSAPLVAPAPDGGAPTEAVATPAAVLPSGASIADVAAAVTPSVVNVFSEKAAAPALQGGFGGPRFQDPFFPYSFQQPGRRFREAPSRREQSLGSGVIVSADGVIITNNHVVAEAEKIRVTLKDGRDFEAKVVGTDPKSDMAVLRVQASGLPAIRLADSSKLRIGDLVLAIGNPFGIGQTVTMGIISAIGRANMGITDYEDFIQTDAAINPGNSGGALVNMAGELVGISTAIVSRSGGYQGIGFAIPSNMVTQVRDAILKDGRVVRGWLGLAIQDLTEPLAETLKVPAKSGVLVSDVTPDGPGAKAGLRRGDIITAIDGTRTEDAAHLRNLVALAGKGKTVSVDLVRDGEKKSVSVELGELPGEANTGVGARTEEQGGRFAGVSVQELDSAARDQRHIPSGTSGVLVTQVAPDSDASHSGLRPDDVIVEINHRPTPDLHAYEQVTEAATGRALVLVLRDGMTLFISLSP